MSQDPLIIGQLEVQQALVEALAACPAKHGNGHEQFARGGVCGETAALTAAMEDQFAALVQPLAESFVGSGGTPSLDQQVSRPAAGT